LKNTKVAPNSEEEEGKFSKMKQEVMTDHYIALKRIDLDEVRFETLYKSKLA
jgi:hypothetical protein